MDGKQIVRLEELEGLTIKSASPISYDEGVALVFDDGRYLAIKARTSYDSVCVEMDEPLSDYEKLSAGLLSQAEYEAIERNKNAARVSEQQERERREYLRLAEKYGKPTP